MTLTQSDLQAIRDVVKDELKPIKSDIKNLDKKFDQHVRFLDTDLSNFKRNTARYLEVQVSDLSAPAK